jgi:HEAT repeat protein
MGKNAKASVPFLIGMLGDEVEFELKDHETDDEEGIITSPGREAAMALVSIGEPSVGPLIEALDSWRYPVRKNAVAALGDIKDPRTLKPLIDARNDSHHEIRKEAIIALGKINDSRAVEPLIGILSGRDEGLKQVAAEYLRRITGAPLDTDPLDWQKWWEVKKTSFLNREREQRSLDIPCPDNCRRMFKKGELNEGVTIEECIRITCGCAPL